MDCHEEQAFSKQLLYLLLIFKNVSHEKEEWHILEKSLTLFKNYQVTTGKIQKTLLVFFSSFLQFYY